MKNSCTIPKILMLCSPLFVLLTFFSSLEAKSIKTQMIRYHNTLIPFVQLKEVIIQAPAGKFKVNPERMSQITAGVISNNQGSGKFFVENVFSNGGYLPHVTLNEITIVADRLETNDTINNTEFKSQQNQDDIHVSVRKSFDRLADFLVEQAKIALHKLVPSWFA